MIKKLLVLLIAFTMFTTLTSAEWTEQDGWSYMWSEDISDHREEIEENLEEGEEFNDGNIKVEIKELEGGFVSMFWMEYAGEENGLHRFDYEGGVYSSSIIDISIETSFEEMHFSVNTRNELKHFDCSASGSIWLKEYNYTEHLPHRIDDTHAYGIVRQTIESEGSIESDIEVKGEGTFDSEDTDMSQEINLIVDWNSFFDITFDPPMPWLTIDGEDIRGNIQVNAQIEEGEMNGNIHLKAVSEGLENREETIEENIDGVEFKTSETLRTSLTRQDWKFIKSSPITNSLLIGPEAILTEVDYSFRPIELTIGRRSPADYDEETRFYDTLYMPKLGPASGMIFQAGFGMYVDEDLGMVPSRSVEKEEFDEFISNRRGYYEEEMGIRRPIIPWFLMIPIAAALASVIAIAFYQHRKKSKYNYPHYNTQNDLEQYEDDFQDDESPRKKMLS